MEIRGVDNIGRVDNNSKINKVNKTDKTSSTSDIADISSEAKQLADIQRAKAAVDKSPDIRQDRIAEVKAKLEKGAYDNEEVMNKVAEKIMKALGL
jgi:negative regulator of flagellin synthesis FlgM